MCLTLFVPISICSDPWSEQNRISLCHWKEKSIFFSRVHPDVERHGKKLLVQESNLLSDMQAMSTSHISEVMKIICLFIGWVVSRQ